MHDKTAQDKAAQDKTAPDHGPKQQPVDPGRDEDDGAAGQGSAAPDGYWLHDDYGPRIYRHPPGDAPAAAAENPDERPDKAPGHKSGTKNG